MFRAAIKQDLPNTEEETKFTNVDTDVGNITLAKNFRSSSDSIMTLPFQIRIRFTMIDGTRRMLVITQTKDFTQNKFEVEKNADVEVLRLNLVHHSAALAQEGKYSYSCQYIQENKSMLDRVILSRDENENSIEIGQNQNCDFCCRQHSSRISSREESRDNNNEMRGLYRKHVDPSRSRSRSRSRSPTWQSFRFYSRPADLSNDFIEPNFA